MSEQTPGRRHGVPWFAIFLVILGVVLLLNTTGVITQPIWGQLWRFWPLLIIAFGINLLFGRRAPVLAAVLIIVMFLGAVGAAYYLSAQESQTVQSTLTEPLGTLKSADVVVNFGAGNLNITSLQAGSPNLVEAAFNTSGRGAVTSLDRSGDKGTLKISMPPEPFFGSWSASDWNIALCPTPTLSLKLNAGAADMKLDLRDLLVQNVDLHIGAASAQITMPATAGQVDATINSGASTITVIIPQGTAARITSKAGISTVNIDHTRFPSVSGGGSQSADYDTNKNRINLDLRVGVATVTVQ